MRPLGLVSLYRVIRRLVTIAIASGVIFAGGLGLMVLVVPELPQSSTVISGPVVNDVTTMNPVVVAREVRPISTEGVQDLLRSTRGSVSIGGGRYSMGGQIASPASLHIDMRSMNQILEVDPVKKLVRVQAGATWQSIQERIDPLNLSVAIMQSYANFTVGGSLSVNVHGRYIGSGPLVGSVESIKVVLADGAVVEASREHNREIFSGCIGGYGGLGVIVEATLRLEENSRLERVVEKVPLSGYRSFFTSKIRGDDGTIFQNGDLLPTSYDEVYSASFHKTEKAVTIPFRLQPLGGGPSLVTRVERFVLMDLPYGMRLRRYLEPLRYRSDQVVWRNYEASYDVAGLQPIASESSSFALQEYFVPVDRLESFVDVLREVLTREQVEVANISIRHAIADSDTIMSWARGEVFAFVLYYRQGIDPDSRRAVGKWTRELMRASVDRGGTYYLPYQLHAPRELFLRAYPRAPELFALKRRLDPEYRFRGGLWDVYFQPDERRRADEYFFSHPDETRSEAQSVLTLPEWRLVYASEDLATVSAHHPQHHFRFFGSIGDFWMLYARTIKYSAGRYGTNWGYHLMNVVIGLNTSVEYIVKGVYENTVGRVTAWLASGEVPDGSIDHFIAGTFADYARFIHTRAWYEYPFMTRLGDLWRIDATQERSRVRHLERLLSFSVELLAKAGLAKIFSAGTEAIYGAEQESVTVVAHGERGLFVKLLSACDVKHEVAPDEYVIRVPRYEPFTTALRELAYGEGGEGISLTKIAGNDRIAVTATVPMGWESLNSELQLIHEESSGDDLDRKRVYISVPVTGLLPFMRDVRSGRGEVIHVYDY